MDLLETFSFIFSETSSRHKTRFISYRNGWCTKQSMIINTIKTMPRIIAVYLKLSSSELYTGYCFRCSSASLLAEFGVDINILKTTRRLEIVNSCRRICRRKFSTLLVSRPDVLFPEVRFLIHCKAYFGSISRILSFKMPDEQTICHCE